ncbi:MAG: hypothetical protein KBI46_08200 [Phycisphaerae bacterium]|nr:hypothetical protein [Phycisphaerae bacterium]
MSGGQKRWRLERRVSVSVLIELITLAGLIVGSWVNLQRQLDMVSHDVKQLLAAQDEVGRKLEQLQERSIAHEYRLQAVERKMRDSEHFVQGGGP